MIDRLDRTVPLLGSRLHRWRVRAGPALLVLAVTLAGAKLALTIGTFVWPEVTSSAALEASPGPPLPEPAAGPAPPIGRSPPKATPPDELPPDVKDPFTATPTPVEQQLLADLFRRRALLDARAEELELHERLIRAAADELERQVEALEQLKTAIDALIEQHDAGEEAEISRLVKIYETMKPKAAAAIFDRLEMPVLLELVTRMKETKASDVMARMRSDRAEALTRELAHQRRLGELLAARLGEGQPTAR